ncbi:unnamed protein product [Brassica rapa subsp. trilocularis]
MNLLVLAGVLIFDSGVASVPQMVVRPLPPVLSLFVGDEYPASDSASHLPIVSARVVLVIPVEVSAAVSVKLVVCLVHTSLFCVFCVSSGG